MNISNVYEFYGMDAEFYRTQALNESYPTLGLDDLVVLHKTKVGLFSQGWTYKFYHHICGLEHSTLSEFPAYFAQLLSLQETSKWQQNYAIKEGICHVFNSFKQEDISINVQLNGKTKYVIHDKEFFPDEESVKQIMLSGLLRYFRNSLLIMNDLFDFTYWDSQCLRIFNDVRKLNIDEFNYILKYHPQCSELYEAVSRGLIYSLNGEEIYNFISENDAEYPNLISQLIKIFPQQSSFFKRMLPLFNRHTELFPDDITTVYYLAKYYLSIFKFDDAKKLFPILQSTITINPLSSISCALYCIYTDRIQESIYYLNCAAYVLDNSPNFVLNHKMKYTNPSSYLDINLSIDEMYIHQSQLCGPKFEYITAISLLCNTVGRSKFHVIFDDFFLDKEEYNQNEIGKIPKYENHHSNECYEKGESTDELYDPGIYSEPLIGDIKMLLPSTLFKTFVLRVNKLYGDRRGIISGDVKINDYTKMIELAIKLMDSQLLQIIIENSLTNGITGLGAVLLIKAFTLGLIKKTQNIANIPITFKSVSEKNCTDWCISFFKKMIELC